MIYSYWWHKGLVGAEYDDVLESSNHYHTFDALCEKLDILLTELHKSVGKEYIPPNRENMRKSLEDAMSIIYAYFDDGTQTFKYSIAKDEYVPVTKFFPNFRTENLGDIIVYHFNK